MLTALLVVGLAVGLLPGVAHAHFDVEGLGGAQLEIPDGPVGTGNFSFVGAAVPIKGRGFVAIDKVLIFECQRDETDLLNNCVTLGTALTDSNGEFSATVQGLYRWVSPSGTENSCQRKFLGGPLGDTGIERVVQCSIAAATYDASLQPTSMADHYLCFGGFADGCTTVRHGSPTTTTTTTTTPPPPSPVWEPGAPMNLARHGLATAVGPDGRIYALGGTNATDGRPDGNAVNAAEVFDPCGTRTWESIAPMPTARTDFAAATGPDGRIYAIGGRESYYSGTPLASVDVYDPVENKWSTVASLAMPRAGMGATTGADGLIYAIGGKVAGGLTGDASYGDHRGGLAVPTVEAYDTATGKWAFVTPLTGTYWPLANLVTFDPESVGAATGPDGRVYAVTPGSANSTLEDTPVPGPVESYSPGPEGTPGTWRKEAAPGGFELPPYSAVTTGPDRRIYDLGGGSGPYSNSFRTVLIFDTDADTWTTSQESLSTRRARPGAAAGKDGRLYVIGGWDGDMFAAGQTLASTESAKVAPNGCPGAPPADFDGNEVTDISVFRPSTGTWFVKDGLTLNYGTQGDIPVPADYDGDKKADVAVFRPSTGTWFVNDGLTLNYGTQGDIPVPADYDGDNKADIAVFRPSNGVWFIHYSGGGDAAFAWGASDDVAVPADYDGDKRADIAVFRNGTWFIRPASGAPDITVNYGTSGDIPVPADYDADNTADIAVFRPSNGFWFLRHSSDSTQEAFHFGTSGDVPVPGYYNGDRVADPAVFRPSVGVWFVETGATAAWGTATDIPLPLPAAVRMAYFPGTG